MEEAIFWTARNLEGWEWWLTDVDHNTVAKSTRRYSSQAGARRAFDRWLPMHPEVMDKLTTYSAEAAS